MVCTRAEPLVDGFDFRDFVNLAGYASMGLFVSLYPGFTLPNETSVWIEFYHLLVRDVKLLGFVANVEPKPWAVNLKGHFWLEGLCDDALGLNLLGYRGPWLSLDFLQIVEEEKWNFVATQCCFTDLFTNGL